MKKGIYGFVDSLANFIIQHAKACFAITLVLVFALIPGLLQFEEKYDVRIWFRETDPNIKILDSFERQFGNDENLVIAVHSPDGLFDKDSLNLLHELTDKMWKLPQVIRVDSLVNYNDTYAEGDDIIVESFIPRSANMTDEFLASKKKRALNHEVLPGYLVSKDARSALLFARLVPTLGGSPDYKKIVNEANELISNFKGRGNHSFHLIGEAAVNDAFRSVSEMDGKRILPILFGLIVLYLLYVFRSFTAMLLPLSVTGLTTLATMGFTFLIGYSFNSILAILPGILVAISIADSVHVMVTYFQFRTDGMDKIEASRRSLDKNLIPTFLTTVSTMIGFFSLTLTELMPIRELGFVAGFGVMVAWIITIFLLGPLLSWLPLKVPKNFIQSKQMQSDNIGPISHKAVAIIKRHQNPILLVFLALTVSGIYLGSQNRVNSNPYEYFTPHIPLRLANDFVREHFGGNAGPELIINAKKVDGIKDPKFLNKVDQYKSYINSLPFVNKTIDMVDIVKDMNRSLNGGEQKYYVIPNDRKKIAEELFLYSMSLPQGMDLNNRMTLDKDAMRMTALWSLFDTQSWLKWVGHLIDKGEELGLDVKATGKFYLFQKMMEYVVETFVISVTMALLLVGLLMTILFRSIKLGLLSLIPNFLPLTFGAGFMKLYGMDLNIGTVIVASVTLGIAVDDTIHFLSNYYRYKDQNYGTEEQIMGRIFTYVGKPLFITTAILVSGFGMYVFGDFIPNVQFGLLCAFVLTLALAVDLIFLPALLFKIESFKKKSS